METSVFKICLQHSESPTRKTGIVKNISFEINFMQNRSYEMFPENSRFRAL